MPEDADPMLREIRVQRGLDLPVVEGYLLAMRAMQQLAADPTVQIATVRAVFDRVIARTPEGVAKHALLMTRKSIYLIEVERGEKQADERSSRVSMHSSMTSSSPCRPCRPSRTASICRR